MKRVGNKLYQGTIHCIPHQMHILMHNDYYHINDDGILIFEDTHTSYLKEFGNPSKYSFINS